MKITFSFDMIDKAKGKASLRKTVFFIGAAQADEEVIYRAVDAHYTTHPASDEVVFLVLASNAEPVIAALKGTRVSSRILQHSHHQQQQKPRLLVIDHSGTIKERSGETYQESIAAKANELERIRQCGAFEIFTRNQGMLEASDTHHYVKPSLKHTDRFIRSGSVLVHGVEIEFLAVWLLPLLSASTRHIYTDSSTINALGFALIHLRNISANHAQRIAPSIHSFESYKGLKHETFPDKANMIVLISASSGGGMIHDLVSKFGIDRSKIRTIFYLGSEDAGCDVLCDLTISPQNSRGYKPAIVTKSGDRGPFPAHSLAVHILAESFVPESPHVEPVLVVQSDIPSWWDDFKLSFVGRGAIKCFSPDPSETDMSNPPPKTTVVGIRAALQATTPFRKRLDQMLLTAIPSSLETVIYLDDESTLAIINRIKSVWKKRPRSTRWIKASQVTKNPAILSFLKSKPTSSTMVVAGVVTDGTSLLDVAQILRDTQTNHALSFFIGLVACPSEKAFKELKSNLVYSQSGVQYGFHFVQEIHLPRIYRNETTCWGDEIDFWEKYESTANVNRAVDKFKEIEDRLGVLRGARTRGLTDELFLPSANGQMLALRRNSVFTVGLDQASAFSQADVFLAIQSVLHGLRTATGRARTLAQEPHKRSVLSPRLFYRFTDGVIQAAFLRAAAHQELDYRMHPDLSKQMGDTLCGIFQHVSNPRAEALLEVLYAIASGKLQLLVPDLRAFINVMAKGIESSGSLLFARPLFKLVKARLG
jgi:hypothetical protein